jgi:Mg-chelatase subunit ChlD
MRIPLRERPKVEDEDHKMADTNSRIDLQLHPTPATDGLLVKIQPPTKPARSVHHVPSDIVLVIDVSGSMGDRAEAPGLDASESAGLSVLDLVKHAAKTIIETLDDNDRLGIVTFCSRAQRVQDLIPMTSSNKAEAVKRITDITDQDATNLWQGIVQGIKVFDSANKGGPNSRVPAMMVLTDGMPNHMCPKAGYVPKLRSMMPLPAPIHTFGFGYSLRSGLLKSISEVAGGSYAFIPDAGMLGTVFVHAVANLQATCATNAVLELQYEEPLERRLVQNLRGLRLQELW